MSGKRINEATWELLIEETFGCDIGNKIWQWYLVGKRRNTRLMKWYESYEVNIASGEFEHKVLYKIYLKYTKMSSIIFVSSSVDNSTNIKANQIPRSLQWSRSLRSLTDSFLFLVSLPSILAGILRSLGSLRSSRLASGRPSQPSQWASRALAWGKSWALIPIQKRYVLIVSPRPSWPGWASQSVYMEKS